MKRLTIPRPDDWHVHFRDGEVLSLVVPDTARQFARAIAMPNLVPPIATTAQALAYRDRIHAAASKSPAFEALMTLYLTDNTSADEILRAKSWRHHQLCPGGHQPSAHTRCPGGHAGNGAAIAGARRGRRQ
jgi:dihydroorotase